MRRPADFTAAVRRGVRAGNTRLVVHRRHQADEDPVLVGLVVSTAVGPAVVRNTVKRRLRHLMADRIAGLTPGTQIVVRALPGAAGADSAELGEALDHALRATARKLDRPR